jgi:hypothetical protein
MLAAPASAVQKKGAACDTNPLIGAGCRAGEILPEPNRAMLRPSAGWHLHPVPTQCIAFSQPVCGCDGRTYRNNCLRQQAKVSLARTGPCL